MFHAFAYVDMCQLKDGSKSRFVRASKNYGAIITGGTPKNREQFLRSTLDGPFVTINCSKINSEEELIQNCLKQMNYFEGDGPGNEILMPVDLRKALQDNNYSILVLEFEELNEELQTFIAQFLKGLVEVGKYDKMIGYACGERESVVRAEPDMSMRIRPWLL